MLSAAYTLLGKVLVDVDLTLDTPAGGRIRITRGAEDTLRIDCDSEQSLWEAYDLAARLGLTTFDYRGLRKLRNPLLQAIEVEVDERVLLYWPADRLPQIRSLRGVLRLLRRRRG